MRENCNVFRSLNVQLKVKRVRYNQIPTFCKKKKHLKVKANLKISNIKYCLMTVKSLCANKVTGERKQESR
jgi:hypothetical protein